MEKTENKLIKATMKGDRKLVLTCYKEIIAGYKEELDQDFNSISLKNYLVCLNCILYKLSYKNKALKEDIFKKRNEFIIKIEAENNLESLCNLGKEILFFYMEINKYTYDYTSNEIVNKALDYIHDNLKEDLSLERVSKEVHISKNHLCNLFNTHIGISFPSYINKAKVEYGKKLLAESSKPLVDIAFECGFNSQSYFCFVFKKIEGITPLDYKKSIKNS